jgi:multicomponent Na+:H+ antiporter subunit E
MVGNLILRLTIWFLLTADFSLPNAIIGLSISLLIPGSYITPEAVKNWLLILGKILWAIPLAYIEAFELILRPHNDEEMVCEKVEERRSHRLVFLDIFLITFTPKTIVVQYHQEGWYEIHRVTRRKKP